MGAYSDEGESWIGEVGLRDQAGEDNGKWGTGDAAAGLHGELGERWEEVMGSQGRWGEAGVGWGEKKEEKEGETRKTDDLQRVSAAACLHREIYS